MRRTKRRQSAQAAAEGMNRSEPMLRKRALMWKDPSTMAHGTTEVKRENFVRGFAHCWEIESTGTVNRYGSRAVFVSCRLVKKKDDYFR